MYAETRIGADGVEEDRVERCEYTPNAIANINSEAVEVEKRGATLQWAPGQPRQFKLPCGKVLKCHMTSNGLGWLKRVPISDPDRLLAATEAYHKAKGETCAAMFGQVGLPREEPLTAAELGEERKRDAADMVAARVEAKHRRDNDGRGPDERIIHAANEIRRNEGRPPIGERSSKRKQPKITMLTSDDSGVDSDDGQPYNISYAPFGKTV